MADDRGDRLKRKGEETIIVILISCEFIFKKSFVHAQPTWQKFAQSIVLKNVFIQNFNHQTIFFNFD